MADVDGLWWTFWPLLDVVVSIEVAETFGQCQGQIRQGVRCQKVATLGDGLCVKCWDEERNYYQTT